MEDINEKIVIRLKEKGVLFEYSKDFQNLWGISNSIGKFNHHKPDDVVLAKLVKPWRSMIKNMAQTDTGALGTLAEDPTRKAVIEKYYNP